MAVFVVVNYFGIRWFARDQQRRSSGGSSAIILLVIVAFLVTAFHGANFSQPRVRADGLHGVFTAIATGGIVFSYLGFRQGDRARRRDRQPAAQRAARRDRLGADHRPSSTSCCRSRSSARCARATCAKGWSNAQLHQRLRPAGRDRHASSGLGWLAVLLYIDAIISPGRHRPDLHDRHRRASRTRWPATATPPTGSAATTTRGVPLVSLFVSLRRRPDRVPAVPELAAAGRLHHLGDRAVLRRRARSCSPRCAARCPTSERPFRLPGRDVIPFLALLVART